MYICNNSSEVPELSLNCKVFSKSKASWFAVVNNDEMLVLTSESAVMAAKATEPPITKVSSESASVAIVDVPNLIKEEIPV